MPRSFTEWMILKAEKSILKTIAYFDMFRYPVTAEEICLFLDQPATTTEVETELALLAAKEQVYKLDEYYSLQNDALLIERRRRGNERADKLLQVAYRIGRLLYKFPF